MVASKSALLSWISGEGESLITNLLPPIKESITCACGEDSTLIGVLDLSLPLVLTVVFFSTDGIRVGRAFGEEGVGTGEEGVRIEGVGIEGVGIEGVGIGDFFAGAFCLINFAFLPLYFGAGALTSLIFWRLAGISSSLLPLALLSLGMALLSSFSLTTVLSLVLAA